MVISTRFGCGSGVATLRVRTRVGGRGRAD